MSSWRYNVFRVGWQYENFLLIARIRSGLPFHDYLGVRTVGSIREVVAGPVSLQGYVFVWDHLFFTADTGFPYGFDVEPDTPM